MLADIPAIRWKLLETYESRLDRAVATDPAKGHFAWQQEYDTGVQVIDEEHRGIFRMAGELYRALFSQASGQNPALLFPQLVRLVEEHFHSEETLMSAESYPSLPSHKRHHEQITQTLRDFAAGFSTRRTTSKKEAGIFIKDWVMTHILTEDRRLGTYLLRRGVR